MELTGLRLDRKIRAAIGGFCDLQICMALCREDVKLRLGRTRKLAMFMRLMRVTKSERVRHE